MEDKLWHVLPLMRFNIYNVKVFAVGSAVIIKWAPRTLCVFTVVLLVKTLIGWIVSFVRVD